MNTRALYQLADAVLYEGYLLYPYRPAACKNVHRFTFGRVYPEAYSLAQKGAEPSSIQTECLARLFNPRARLKVAVRFLHPAQNRVARLIQDSAGPNPDSEPAIEFVPELRAGGKLFQTSTTAVERAVNGLLEPFRIMTGSVPISLPASHSLQPIRDSSGRVVGQWEHTAQALKGTVELAAEALDSEVFRIRVRILNQTPVAEAELQDSQAVLLRTFASTQTILHLSAGEFLSLTNPPAAYATASAECKNIGTWPVLVGDETRNERDVMLSAPIILYDYPEIAPESAGDLCDATEIDELLSLRIQTLTDAEKAQMRNADALGRKILERTESLPADDLARMHGVMRQSKPSAEEIFGPGHRLDSVRVNGRELKRGDRVRIRPRKYSDVIDSALAGKAAVIESIEQDTEDRIYLAIVIEDDPGRDLGMLRQPGHRFFYGLDEVEPLEKEPA